MKILNHDSDPTLTVLVTDQSELWHLRQAMEQWCKFLDQDQEEGRGKKQIRAKARLSAEILMRDLDNRVNHLLYAQTK